MVGWYMMAPCLVFGFHGLPITDHAIHVTMLVPSVKPSWGRHFQEFSVNQEIKIRPGSASLPLRGCSGEIFCAAA